MKLTTENKENTERATPETDAEVTTFTSISKLKRRFECSTGKVSAGFARQLERERDEAREVLAATKHYLTKERDDTLSQIVQAECRAERFCQERDEAREELAKIESLLLDPHAVFLNFLHGKIAKLDWAKLEHIHGPHPALKERDEARGVASGLAKQAERLRKERDEAREVLREIAEASGFDNIGNWARSKARKALEGAK